MSAYIFPVDAVSGSPSYSGRAGRQALSVLAGGGAGSRPLAGRSGVNPRTPTTTVTATSTTWTVLPHGGYIDGETASQAGGYLYSFDSNQTGSMTAADGTNQRVDSICIQISDPAESDGTSTPSVAVIYTTGTPGTAGGARGAAGGPPNVPVRSLEIAQINVPKSGTGSPTVSWVARRMVAAGGIVPCASSADYPSSPYVGQYIDDATLGLRRWNGASWSSEGGLQWQYKKTDTPTVASGVFVKFVMNTSVIDTAGIGLTSGAFTCPVSGNYRVGGSVTFASNSSGRRGGGIMLNPTGTLVPIDGTETLLPANPTGITVVPVATTLVSANAGDVIALIGYQDTGSSLAVGMSQLTIELT